MISFPFPTAPSGAPTSRAERRAAVLVAFYDGCPVKALAAHDRWTGSQVDRQPHSGQGRVPVCREKVRAALAARLEAV